MVIDFVYHCMLKLEYDYTKGYSHVVCCVSEPHFFHILLIAVFKRGVKIAADSQSWMN